MKTAKKKYELYTPRWTNPRPGEGTEPFTSLRPVREEFANDLAEVMGPTFSASKEGTFIYDNHPNGKVRFVINFSEKAVYLQGLCSHPELGDENSVCHDAPFSVPHKCRRKPQQIKHWGVKLSPNPNIKRVAAVLLERYNAYVTKWGSEKRMEAARRVYSNAREKEALGMAVAMFGLEELYSGYDYRHAVPGTTIKVGLSYSHEKDKVMCKVLFTADADDFGQLIGSILETQSVLK